MDNRYMTEQEFELGKWLSAALDDDWVCDQMKQDINNWFAMFKTLDSPEQRRERGRELMRLDRNG